VVVVVVTTGRQPALARDNVPVAPGLSGLSRPSTVSVTSVRTVDREDLEFPVGRLDTSTLRRVDAGLRSVLSL